MRADNLVDRELYIAWKTAVDELMAGDRSADQRAYLTSG